MTLVIQLFLHKVYCQYCGLTALRLPLCKKNLVMQPSPPGVLVVQWSEHLISITEVKGSIITILTRNSDFFFSCSLIAAKQIQLHRFTDRCTFNLSRTIIIIILSLSKYISQSNLAKCCKISS